MPPAAASSRDEVRRLIGLLGAGCGSDARAEASGQGDVVVDLSKTLDIKMAFALVRLARARARDEAGRPDPRDTLEAALVAKADALMQEQLDHDDRLARRASV